LNQPFRRKKREYVLGVRNISFAACTRLCLGQIWDELSVQQFSLGNAGGVSRSLAVALFSWMLEVDLIGKGSLTDLNGFVTAQRLRASR